MRIEGAIRMSIWRCDQGAMFRGSQQLCNAGLYLVICGNVVKSFACPKNSEGFILLLKEKVDKFLKSNLHVFLYVDSHYIIEN